MAIDQLSQLVHLPIYNVPCAPAPTVVTSDDASIDPQKTNSTCTPDLINTKAHRPVVGVENTEGYAYHKATGLYNNHGKYSAQWNP